MLVTMLAPSLPSLPLPNPYVQIIVNSLYFHQGQCSLSLAYPSHILFLLPNTLSTATFTWIILFIPVVLALIKENFTY